MASEVLAERSGHCVDQPPATGPALAARDSKSVSRAHHASGVVADQDWPGRLDGEVGAGTGSAPDVAPSQRPGVVDPSPTMGARLYGRSAQLADGAALPRAAWTAASVKPSRTSGVATSAIGFTTSRASLSPESRTRKVTYRA